MFTKHHFIVVSSMIWLQISIGVSAAETPPTSNFWETLGAALAESAQILAEEIAAEQDAANRETAAQAAEAAAQAAAQSDQKPIRPHVPTYSLFEDLKDCQLRNTGVHILRLLKLKQPLHKTNDAWSYKVKGQMYGIPVKMIDLGVCDISGNAECGAASYTAVRLDMPFTAAKQHLISKYKIDFTQELRSANEIEGFSGETLRPILTRDAQGQALMYCDLGGM